MPSPDDRDRLDQVIIAEIFWEALATVAPDVFIRRDCAFCHRERTARDDNHAPDCCYWVFFPPP